MNFIILKKSFYFLISFLVLIIIGSILVRHFTDNKKELTNGISYEYYMKDDSISLAVEKFLEDKNEISKMVSDSNVVCAAVNLWEKDFEQDEKAAMMYVECLEVTMEDNKIKKGFYFNNPSMMFKLKKESGNWKITDYDDRTYFKAETKDWVKEYLEQIPDQNKDQTDKDFMEAKLVSKIGKIFGIEIPSYSFQYCSNNNDCSNGEICVTKEDHSQAINKCVKQCTSHSECGNGYACRKYYSNGNYNNQNICTVYFDDINGFISMPNEPF